jgi:hypothetical protein
MTTVRARITGAHRDTTPAGKVEHLLFVQLLPEDGAVGEVTVNVSPEEYEVYARNFPHVVEVEVKLLFDKQPST